MVRLTKAMMLPEKVSKNPAAIFSGYTGIGLRPEHLETILTQKPDVDYFEVLADNYFSASNSALEKLQNIADHYPLSLHCVGLSIATASEPDYQYLQSLKILAQRFNCTLLSDHLCWTHANGHYTHELLPFPYTESTLSFIIEKTLRIQDFLKQPLMLENVSRYVSYEQNTLEEAQFLNELCHNTNCGILLDINNLYVNWYNHGDNLENYFQTLNPKHVWQMHLGGFSKQPGYFLDSHSDRVYPEVWPYFERAQTCFVNTPTIMEWDNELPEFKVLLEEMNKARSIIKKTTIGNALPA